MREIEFRAWYPDAKKMHDISLYQIGECLVYKTNFPERIEIMQFTGLLDKNGKKIFEGDILLDSDYHGVCEFDVNTSCFTINRNKFGTGGLGLLNKEMEIIGNIFENTELLEART